MKRCKHIWQDGKEIILRTRKECDTLCGVVDCDKYEYYAIEETCIVCGEKRLTERRRIII